jgi:surface antigen-like variable number repeat protein
MKPTIPVFCLMVTLAAASAEPSAGQDTGPARTSAVRSLRVREVRFDGDPAFKSETLKKVLEELKGRPVIPGVWTRLPQYEGRAVAADLARLRSFYISQGYFDARVEVGGLTVAGREAILTLNVQSGPKYSVRQVKFDGINREVLQPAVGASGEFPGGRLCACLVAARRIAEAHGYIDFAAELDVSRIDAAAESNSIGKWVDVTARVRSGSPYTVGRITFSGHHRTNDSTLRRAITLRERAVFDVGQLRTSLARLNSSGLFAPLMLRDVEIDRKPNTLTADLKITVRERPGRRWSLSGPIVPATLATSLEARISSRLPPWGRGIFEASTYYVTFSLVGFLNPLDRLLPNAARPARALLVLERPYLPGQGLSSGFEVSPQLSVSGLLASYGFNHLDATTQVWLKGADPGDSGLLVPILGSRQIGAGHRLEAARFLICKPPLPRHQWLRRLAAVAANLAFNALRPI